MIISGRCNIYPSEIEQVIWSHPAVQDCAVIGGPDEEWGEVIKAVIELKPSHCATEAHTLVLCREKLGGMKTSKTAEFIDALPRSPVGKVLKKDLQARDWGGANAGDLMAGSETEPHFRNAAISCQAASPASFL